MENYKVKVNSEAESKEVQGLFFSLGAKWRGSSSKTALETTLDFPIVVCVEDGNLYLSTNIVEDKKELTIPQLRDMVVLKRNDVNDKNAFCHDNGEHYYITSDGKYYFFLTGGKDEWGESSNDISYLEKHVKPITKAEPVMKEFLNPSQNYGLVTCGVGETPIPKDWIEVPEGAEKYIQGVKFPTRFGFVKGVKFWDGEWIGHADKENEYKVVWQRETLNDKVKTAEVARQEFIAAPFDDLPEFNFKGADSLVDAEFFPDEKHSHYKKDISHLNTLDIYRVTELFNPHSCGAHIAKKALCSGQRGHKDLLTDIQDIIDTAERWKEMLIEDEKAK